MKTIIPAIIEIKPAAVKVVDPQTGQPIPEEGTTVPLNKYWRRRIQDGSVVVLEAQPKKQKQTATKEAE